MERSTADTPVVARNVSLLSDCSFLMELDDSDSDEELPKEASPDDPYFVAETDEEDMPVDDDTNISWGDLAESMADDTSVIPESDEEEEAPDDVDKARDTTEEDPGDESSGVTLNASENTSFHRFLRVIIDGNARQLFSYTTRRDDDNGNVPLIMINRTQLDVMALGFIVVFNVTKVRMIPVLAGQMMDVLAKCNEDFIFAEDPLDPEGSNQVVGFCAENGSKIEYYLKANTASEITIGNKIQGMRSLTSLCSDLVWTHTGNSLAAISQLPLSLPLRDHLTDHLSDKLENSFHRAKKLLDEFMAWMKLFCGVFYHEDFLRNLRSERDSLIKCGRSNGVMTETSSSQT